MHECIVKPIRHTQDYLYARVTIGASLEDMKHKTWADYLTRITGGDSQTAIAIRTDVAQPTVSRWLRGTHRPTEAGVLARVAVAYERNPLEAFVAAEVLPIELAHDALDADSLELLADLGFTTPPPPRAAQATA